MNNGTDKQLVENHKKGSEDAFAAIYAQYMKLVHSAVNKVIVNETQREDAAQEVWVHLLEALKKDDWDPEKSTLRAFIYTRASARAKNYLRDEAQQGGSMLGDRTIVSADAMDEAARASEDDDAGGFSEAEGIDRGVYGAMSDGHYRGSGGAGGMGQPIITNPGDYGLENQLIADETESLIWAEVGQLKQKYVDPISDIIDEGYKHGILQSKAEEYNLEYHAFRQVWLRFQTRITAITQGQEL